MTVFAERLGLSVPETWSYDPELLPLVVKGRVGAGGRAVRLVYSEQERDAAVRELGTDVFFQDVVNGDLINVSGVARQGEVCLLVAYRAIAAELGCTPTQLALAWLLHQGPHILPILGTRSADHLRDGLGALAVQLPAPVLAQLDGLINSQTVYGDRYNAQANSEVDTEVF
jgi:hypothetical protein